MLWHLLTVQDEATDREHVNGQRTRHGHHARALVEHIKNVIPGRHDNDRGDGSASDTDRGDRAGFSPRAFAHGLRPFRTITDNVTNGSPAPPRARHSYSPHPSDDDADVQMNGHRNAPKPPSTRTKVANAIRNRAHPKPSQEKLGKPMVEHVDDIDSLNAVDALVESKEGEADQKINPVEINEPPKPVPRVRIEDDRVSEIYRLRKEQVPNLASLTIADNSAECGASWPLSTTFPLLSILRPSKCLVKSHTSKRSSRSQLATVPSGQTSAW
jgi:hypothetical protein